MPAPAQGLRSFRTREFPKWNLLAPLMQFPPLSELSFEREAAAASTCSLINLRAFNELNSKCLFLVKNEISSYS